MDEVARLKAAGFSDQEIRLHQAGFSDAEIQGHTGATAAKPPAPSGPKTLLDTVIRSAENLPQDALNTGIAINRAGNAILEHPIPTAIAAAKAAGSALKSGVDIAKGGLQHVREMSPAEYQGSAAPMDKTAYDKFAEDNYNKYGTKENTYKTVSDHPLGAALTAASVVVPALRATRLDSLVAKGVDGAVSRVAPAVSKVTGAERRSLAASAAMRDEAQSDFANTADNAAARAERAAAYAEQAKRRQGATLQRQADAAKAAVPPDPAIAEPAHLSEIGDSVREPSYAAQSAIESKMQSEYAQHKAVMDAITEDRRKAGVGVSDGVTAKALVKQSEALVNPDPITRPEVGPRLAKSAGGNLHEGLLNVLKEKRTPLNEADAVLAKKAGVPVYKSPDGALYRLDKPDFKTVDNFRRFVGEVVHGKVNGYEAISKDEATHMYEGLTQALDEYTAGASKPLREAWKTGKQQLEPFERVRTGQAIVGMQKGTNVPIVPSARIPGRMVSGGRDTMQQAAAVAGEEPAVAALRSHVQNELTGLNSSAAILGKVGKGTSLGDAIHAYPDLEGAVAEHIAKVKAAEAQGALASTLGDSATKWAGRSKQFEDAAKALEGTSATYAGDLAKLNLAAPHEVGDIYTNMLERAYKEKRIGLDQYTRGHALARSAASDFKLKASRDKWLKSAATTLGIASVGGGAVTVVRGAANLAK